MELKPIFSTNNIQVSNNKNIVKKLENKIIVDPEKIIPNDIYKVINWEKIRQYITLWLTILVLLTSIVLIIIYSFIYKTKWVGFIIPSFILLVSFWKTMSTILEIKYFKKSINRYREDLKIDLTYTPPFITKLYFRLYEKQVSHNWITFVLIFYFGILTLLLWWLKDVSWWIFEFNEWIKALFSNPTLMVWIFTISLFSIIIIYIFLSIQRKKKILEIDSYFGNQIISYSEITNMKDSKNKMYRRLFIFSILILFVIPIVIKIILKILKIRKK